MNSRERIIKALNHTEADGLPIDFGSMGSTGISIIANNRLKRYLGYNERKSILNDLGQQLAAPEPEIMERFGADVINIRNPHFYKSFAPEQWKEWTLKDGSTCLVTKSFDPIIKLNGDMEIWSNGILRSRMPVNSFYFDSVYRPCENVMTIKDIDNIKLDMISEAELEFLEEQAEYLYYNTDKALLYSFGGNILERGMGDFGHERFLVEMGLNTEFVHYWFEKLTEYYIVRLEKVLNRISKYINIINFGDDLGTQNAPIISPQMYKNLIKPYHSRLYQYVHGNYPDLKVFLHSCGSIKPLIPDLIDAGVDILNPVQISANGMEPEKLKKEFGRDMVFWGGGVNTQTTLVNGSIDGIKDEVRRLIEIFWKDGGYVFNTVHNIQADIPPEKVTAVFDTALDFRK